MSGDAKSQEELSIEADEVRSKLLRTVEELDQRRHEALDLRFQIKRHLERHLEQVVLASGVLVLATAGTAAFVAYRLATAVDRRRRNRWRLAKYLWQRPERALRAQRRSWFAEIGRSALVALAGTLVTLPVRRLLTSRMEKTRSGPSTR
ncbi:MAG: hypothetical protein M3O46_15195 [Myxococcota bacterium]|nr:hypothetical protein [Myxococcota bacterium]